MRGRREPAQDANKHWIGEVQPVGIVVTAEALAEQALVPTQQTRLDSEAVRELVRPERRSREEERDAGAVLPDPWAFFSAILDWRPSQVAGSPDGPEVPDTLRVSLPASETVLEPQLAVMTPDKSGWQLLVRVEWPGVEPDKRGALTGWEATPHQRFERLLRDTGVPTGLLLTDDAVRLVHAPRNGETSGWFSVPLRALGTTAGRSMLGGLKLLLDRHRLFGDAEPRRLPALLDASRRAQAAVSTKLATQVLGALHELLRGLHAADPEPIASLARSRPTHLYEGLLAVLMRLVFLLYAEDRGLIPSRDDPRTREFYDQGYGVRALHLRLLENEALYPDTMDERRGAWHRLLALFRLVHRGDGTGWMRGRGGKLFDPATFPFLQGQGIATDPLRLPSVSDGCVLRVLDGLLTLGGERLSYRALDVEQIGSVYETVMGFTAQPAAGPSLAIKAGKHDRTPVFVDLVALLKQPGKDRLKWLKEHTERGKFPAKVEKAITAGTDEAALEAALLAVVDERGSPGARVWRAGTPLLQPTDERRRSGSHYTPRDLTAPIVLHALAPAFERIGVKAVPEAVLSLKVCDPAMGSGAFLVEACRQLAARLVEAWRVHEALRPTLPPDETEELHARRMVAQRCIYGVDRNPMATDLARLSLWLATLARDHEFTFLDHSLRTGDSLVGLTRAQIGGFRWQDGHADVAPFSGFVRERVLQALEARDAIRTAPDDIEQEVQQQRFRHVETLATLARMLGDATLAAFFGNDKSKARETARRELGVAASQSPERAWPRIEVMAAGLTAEHDALRPFHWELEFPEVFVGETPGFDAIVGNPPFAGKNTLINGNRAHYLDWLQTVHAGAHGNADLVAHFVRRAFGLLRPGGCFGLIATNTVGQGDTRESGLRAVIEAGGTILRAIRRVPWPGVAAVVVSVVHVVRGIVRSPVLDGRQVRRISAYLMEGDLDASPARLAANVGKAFQGFILLGMGFTFDDVAVARGKPASTLAEMERLIAKDPRNAERIFPYLGGEEVNTDPRHMHRRWCIDFNDFPLRREAGPTSWAAMEERERSICRRTGVVPEDYRGPVAADWPDLLAIVERLVKPEREEQKRDALREKWWQFAEKRPGLRAALRKRSGSCIATLRVKEAHSFISLPREVTFANTIYLFPELGPGAFGILESFVHEVWVRAFSSTLEERLNYSSSDCFETFVLPQVSNHLERVSSEYQELRTSLMVTRSEGLTSLYDAFHDKNERNPDIVQLRELHHDLNQAALRAYGWDDLAERVSSEFLCENSESEHRFQGRLFWSAPFRDEVLARLLVLNAEHSAAERARGLAPAPRIEEPEDA